MNTFTPHPNHWKIHTFAERVTREQLQYVLLRHSGINFNGTPMDWGFKHVGVGIYNLFKKESA